MWDDDAEGPSDANTTDQNGDANMVNGIQEDSISSTGATTASSMARSEESDSGIAMDDRPVSTGTRDVTERPEPESSTLNPASSNLISRRQASNVSLPRDGAGTITLIDMPPLMTPTHAHDTSTSTDDTNEGSQEDRGRLCSPTPQSSEQVAQDAMLTPTNNAGPFVFDGSAGRASGRRLTASGENIEDTPA